MKKKNHNKPAKDYRVSNEEYQKCIINTKTRLLSDESSVVSKKNQKDKLDIVYYDNKFNQLGLRFASKAVAKHEKQGNINYYYLRFNNQNELINVHNKVHMNDLKNGNTLWQKVNYDSFVYYSDFLKSDPPRMSSYDSAKSNFMV